MGGRRDFFRGGRLRFANRLCAFLCILFFSLHFSQVFVVCCWWTFGDGVVCLVESDAVYVVAVDFVLRAKF